MNFEKRKVILVLVLLTVAVGLPFFLKDSRYDMNIFQTSREFCCSTYSLNFIHGISWRLISIGHAGFFAVGAYVTAGLTMAVGITYFVALPLAAIASALTGVLLGVPALRMGGHYFVLNHPWVW